MLDLTSADVVTHGVKLHYYRTGGDKPALVLVHGITDDGLCWTPVAAALAEKYDVILVDVRGHGKSEAPVDGYTLENLGLELAGLIQALGLEKPIVLGHSMGAINTLVMAGLFPALPRAILLEDPPPFWMATENQPQNNDVLNGMTAWLQSNKRKTHADLLAEVRTQNPGWAEAELEPWVNSKHRFSLNIVALIRPNDLISIQFPRLMQQITCPALFISADPARGAISQAGDIAEMKAHLPQLQVAHIPDAGHNIRRDQFERYLETVQQFLANL